MECKNANHQQFAAHDEESRLNKVCINKINNINNKKEMGEKL
jgi:hypothetical protein